MKPTTIPVICSMALAAMLAAGTSHWWSVHQFTGLLAQGLPAATPASALDSPATKEPATPTMAHAMSPSKHPASTDVALQANAGQQKEFYEALIDKLARMETQNRDLLDQLAETNRDLMKLEFRVDTHSESFRPLPLVEEQPFSHMDANNGVLPPRNTTAPLPSYE